MVGPVGDSAPTCVTSERRSGPPCAFEIWLLFKLPSPYGLRCFFSCRKSPPNGLSWLSNLLSLFLPLTCCNQLALKQRIVLHDVKAIQALHIVLLEEKRCRDSLAVVVKKNPVDFYEEFRLGLEHARRLGFDPSKEPLMVEAQRLFDSVKDRIEVCWEYVLDW